MEEMRRRLPLVGLLRRAIGRPYLLMAAVILIVGAIWFIRLGVQEFLLIDRLINVYTNDAQLKMDMFTIKPGVTATVLEVLVSEGDLVHKGQVLVRLTQDDIQAELRRAEALADSIQQQLQETRMEIPLAIEQATHEVSRAKAVLETKNQAWRRAQELLAVQRDRVAKMLGEQGASLEATRARLREQQAEAREAAMKLERTRSLFTDGIVPRERLDADQITLERAQARLAAAEEQVRQVAQHYPSGDSPEMIRVHQKDVQGAAAEVKEQLTVVALAQTRLRLAALGEQRLKVLEAKWQEAQAQVEATRLKLDKTVLRSPVDGVVGYRNVEPGEIVEGDPSNPPIMMIHDPDSFWVMANIWESDISRVRVGLEAEIWVDAFRTSSLGRGRPFRGRVQRINPTTSSEIQSLPPERFFTRREQKVSVKIAFESTEPGFRAGMLAEVLIVLNNGAAAQEQ